MAENRVHVVELNTGRIRPMWETQPLISSARLPWQGFLVEEFRTFEMRLDNVYLDAPVITLQLDGPLTLEWCGEGQRTILPGAISIIPPNLPFSLSASTAAGVLMISLDQQILACAAADIGVSGFPELRTLHGIQDVLLRAVMLELRSEAKNKNPEGVRYAESLASALAVHILHRYSAIAVAMPALVGGLSKQQLRRVIEYIHGRLAEQIRLREMAASISLSPFHFARLFKQSTGFSPCDYVIRCRIERARQLLMRLDASTSEIAIEVGFCDQSHLTRHFRRILGLTPAKFMRSVPRNQKNS
jgi:AraC family transcriptional regulator